MISYSIVNVFPMIIIPFLNGYFIGNIPNMFRHTHIFPPGSSQSAGSPILDHAGLIQKTVDLYRIILIDEEYCIGW